MASRDLNMSIEIQAKGYISNSTNFERKKKKEFNAVLQANLIIKYRKLLT